jgi:hypothetical protein
MTKPTRQQPSLTEPTLFSVSRQAAAPLEFHLAPDMSPEDLKPEGMNAEEALPEDGQPLPAPRPSPAMGRSLAQILIVLVVLLVLVNIPLNSLRAGLVQLVPHNSAMVIYDGLLLQGSGAETYVVQDYKLRWISSPEAFRHYFDAADVRIVEDSFLEQFGRGQPIRWLVRCQDSPTVYALENGQKRWVKDPPPANQASVWDRIGLVSCSYLRSFTTGLPVPEDAGSPPQP